MNESYQLVVFDWEGTLGDTLGKLLELLKSESLRMGLNEIEDCKARGYLLMGLHVALKKIFPTISQDQAETLTQRIREVHASRSKEVYLIPGAREIIQSIYDSGIDLAIATNRSHQSLHRDLQAADLEQYFTVTRSADQVPAKPSPKMLEEIMDLCGATSEKTLMIGDTVSDIAMAKALGVKAFGVHFYHQQEMIQSLFDEGAEKVFEDYASLSKALNLKK